MRHRGMGDPEAVQKGKKVFGGGRHRTVEIGRNWPAPRH
jgi:hypothetical protein